MKVDAREPMAGMACAEGRRWPWWGGEPECGGAGTPALAAPVSSATALGRSAGASDAPPERIASATWNHPGASMPWHGISDLHDPGQLVPGDDDDGVKLDAAYEYETLFGQGTHCVLATCDVLSAC